MISYNILFFQIRKTNNSTAKCLQMKNRPTIQSVKDKFQSGLSSGLVKYSHENLHMKKPNPKINKREHLKNRNINKPSHQIILQTYNHRLTHMSTSIISNYLQPCSVACSVPDAEIVRGSFQE